MCGVEKGRAVRDIIVHQTTINIKYLTNKFSYKKEQLFIIINNEKFYVDFFANFLIIGIRSLILNLERFVIENVMFLLNNY